MRGTVGIIGGTADRRIEDLIRELGLRPLPLQPDQLVRASPVTVPDVVLVDVREDRQLLTAIGTIKRRYPTMGVAIIVPALEPELMLEAMRAGVTECLPDPITRATLEAALGRIMALHDSAPDGRVIAVLGAKGGVGATTIAVNLAEVLARTNVDTLLVDLNLVAGDASLFLGVEPRFSVADALENTQRLDEAFFRGLVEHTRSGLDFLAATGRQASALDPQHVRALLSFAVRYYRCVVLDVPRSEPALLDILEGATTIFVVVNHELPSIRSACRLVAKLRQRYSGDRVSLLVNRSDRQSEISVADIEKAVNARVKFTLPSDYKPAILAINRGQPLAETSQGRLAGAFHAFARSLTEGAGAKAPVRDDPGGLFGWLSPRRATS